MFQTIRYYYPNLLFFKQRTTENSLKGILFFAKGFKDEMIKDLGQSPIQSAQTSTACC